MQTFKETFYAIQKPELDHFKIYRDAKLDYLYELKRHSLNIGRVLGYLLKKVSIFSLWVLDDLVESVQPQKSSI